MTEHPPSMLLNFAVGIFLLGLAVATPEWGFAIGMSDWSTAAQEIMRYALMGSGLAVLMEGIM